MKRPTAPRLLHIEASPRKERSHSSRVARAFVEAYTAHRPDIRLDLFNLWEDGLPAFDGPSVAAKYAVLGGQQHSEQEATAWNRTAAVFHRFARADKILFSVPMWNFGVPYRLKQFIDIVTQPTLAFSYSPESGYAGLLSPRPVAVVYASANDFAAGNGSEALDFQKPYLEAWLRFIGLGDIRRIVVAPTVGDLHAVKRAVAEAEKEAVRLAQTF